MVPVVHRCHSKCFVEGVVRQALQRMTTDRYSSLYTIVYEGCTTKPPNNQVGYYYDALTKLRPTLEKVLATEPLDQERRRRRFAEVHRGYIDRSGAVRP